jgi:hypothetical protein
VFHWSLWCEVTGWLMITIRRGEILFADDMVVGQPGSGMLLNCGATTGLSL